MVNKAGTDENCDVFINYLYLDLRHIVSSLTAPLAYSSKVSSLFISSSTHGSICPRITMAEIKKVAVVGVRSQSLYNAKPKKTDEIPRLTGRWDLMS